MTIIKDICFEIDSTILRKVSPQIFFYIEKSLLLICLTKTVRNLYMYVFDAITKSIFSPNLIFFSFQETLNALFVYLTI